MARTYADTDALNRDKGPARALHSHNVDLRLRLPALSFSTPSPSASGARARSPAECRRGSRPADAPFTGTPRLAPDGHDAVVRAARRGRRTTAGGGVAPNETRIAAGSVLKPCTQGVGYWPFLVGFSADSAGR